MALLTSVAAFALGFLLVVWLYRFARRRAENDAPEVPGSYLETCDDL